MTVCELIRKIAKVWPVLQGTMQARRAAARLTSFIELEFLPVQDKDDDEDADDDDVILNKREPFVNVKP